MSLSSVVRHAAQHLPHHPSWPSSSLHLFPLPSTSRLPYSCTPYRLSSSSLFPSSTRKTHALAQSSIEPSGFEGIPPPMYSGVVESSADVKGKGKEKEHIVEESPAPRRKVAIKSKKAAITMTPAAISRLRELVSSPTSPLLLRIGVKTRGCAGMAYHLDYVPPPGGKFDEVVEQDGVRVLIDSKALFSIIGSRMDWRDNRLSAGFVFDNPNVVDTCGCGESFNIQH